MKALVFCDDLYHPASTVRAGLAPLVAAGWDFDWVEDATHWSPEALSGYRVALLAKSNVRAHGDKTPWLTGAHEAIFQQHVVRGGGLLAVHSGTASYQDVRPVRAVLGGVFLSHPPPGEVTVEPRRGHLMAAGVDDPFTVHDEHYQMVLDDPRADIFLHTRSGHGVQPAGWTRTEGTGRVCVLTPGHFPAVWLHPSFQSLLRNALRRVSFAPAH